MNRPHENRNLRAAMLRLARTMLADGREPHAGDVEVHVRDRSGTAEVIIRAASPGEADTPPEEDDFLDALTRRLLASFLSDEERTVLAQIAAGPSRGELLIDRCRIERSRFYVIARQLRDRDLLWLSPDGYRLTDWFDTELGRRDTRERLGL